MACYSGYNTDLVLIDSIETFSIESKFDTVVNCGTYIGGTPPDGVNSDVNVNVISTIRLLAACKRAAISYFVQVSSIYAKIKETSPFYTIDSCSKNHADSAAAQITAADNMDLLIVRPANIFGVGESYRKHQPFLANIMDRAQQNQDIIINGTKDVFLNFIHEEDVAMAISKAIQLKLVGQYDCIYPVNVRHTQIAQAAIAAFNSTSRVSFDPEDPDNRVCKFKFDDALYQAIDYFPQISILKGFQIEAALRGSNIEPVADKESEILYKWNNKLSCLR